MTTMPDSTTSTLRDALLLTSRLLLSLIFVHEAVFLITNFTTASAGMAKLGVPPVLFDATIALQLGAGLAIVLGWPLRPAAIALGLFCVATAVLFHTNFDNRNELLQFEKDFAMAGGMFALAMCGAGRWTVVALWQAARRTQT